MLKYVEKIEELKNFGFYQSLQIPNYPYLIDVDNKNGVTILALANTNVSILDKTKSDYFFKKNVDLTQDINALSIKIISSFNEWRVYNILRVNKNRINIIQYGDIEWVNMFLQDIMTTGRSFILEAYPYFENISNIYEDIIQNNRELFKNVSYHRISNYQTSYIDEGLVLAELTIDEDFDSVFNLYVNKPLIVYLKKDSFIKLGYSLNADINLRITGSSNDIKVLSSKFIPI